MLAVRRGATVEPVVADLVAVDLVVVDGVVFLVARADDDVRDTDTPAAVLGDTDDAPDAPPTGLLPPNGA